MKTLLLMMITIYCIHSPLFAQFNLSAVPLHEESNEGGISLPQNISERFERDYPSYKASWMAEGDNFSAEYKDESTKKGYVVTYNKSGNLVCIDRELDAIAYPPPICNFYHDTYPNEKFQVWCSEDVNGTKSYYSKRDNGIIWFDGFGNYLGMKPVKSIPVRSENKPD